MKTNLMDLLRNMVRRGATAAPAKQADPDDDERREHLERLQRLQDELDLMKREGYARGNR